MNIQIQTEKFRSKVEWLRGRRENMYGWDLNQRLKK